MYRVILSLLVIGREERLGHATELTGRRVAGADVVVCEWADGLRRRFALVPATPHHAGRRLVGRRPPRAGVPATAAAAAAAAPAAAAASRTKLTRPGGRVVVKQVVVKRRRLAPGRRRAQLVVPALPARLVAALQVVVHADGRLVHRRRAKGRRRQPVACFPVPT